MKHTKGPLADRASRFVDGATQLGSSLRGRALLDPGVDSQPMRPLDFLPPPLGARRSGYLQTIPQTLTQT